jgi:flagellar motor switch protein FliM
MPVRWDALPRLGREEARLLDAVARRLPTGPPPGPEARDAIESVLGQTFGAEGGVEIVPGAVAAMTFGEFVGGSRAGVNVRLTLGTGEAAAAWIESELAHRIIDRLLGGKGGPPRDLRDLTGVEAGLISYVLLRAVRALHRVAGAEAGSLIRLSGVGAAVGDLPAGETCLVLTTKVTLEGWTGEVRTALPASAAESLGGAAAAGEIPSALGASDLWLRAEVGATELSAADLEALEPGDVLVPDTLYVAPTAEGIEGGCCLRFAEGGRGGIRATLRATARGLRAEVRDFLVGGLPERGTTEETMDENEQVPDVEPSEPLEEVVEEELPTAEPVALPEGTPGEAAEMVREIPLTVSIEMGRTRMSVAEVSAMRAGQIVELRRSPRAPVDLVVGGRVVARGELIEIQGELGVRISEVGA